MSHIYHIFKCITKSQVQQVNQIIQVQPQVNHKCKSKYLHVPCTININLVVPFTKCPTPTPAVVVAHDEAHHSKLPIDSA
jgi:hypothetical protein